MSLPAWVDCFKCHDCDREKVIQALSIAWDTLDAPIEHLPLAARKEAMHRISELGGPSEPRCTCYGPQGAGHAPTCEKEKGRIEEVGK